MLYKCFLRLLGTYIGGRGVDCHTVLCLTVLTQIPATVKCGATRGTAQTLRLTIYKQKQQTKNISKSS